MTDIAIEKNENGRGWDLALVDGDLYLLPDTYDPNEQVVLAMQDITYTLETWLGESPYEPSAGVPYMDFVFGSTRVGGVVQYLMSLVRARPYVESTENLTFTLSVGRELAIAGDVIIAGKVVPVDLLVTP